MGDIPAFELELSKFKALRDLISKITAKKRNKTQNSALELKFYECYECDRVYSQPQDQPFDYENPFCKNCRLRKQCEDQKVCQRNHEPKHFEWKCTRCEDKAIRKIYSPDGIDMLCSNCESDATKDKKLVVIGCKRCKELGPLGRP